MLFYPHVTECLHVICSGLWGILTTKQTESEYFLRRAWCHLNVWKAPFASSQLIPDRPIRGGLACVPCVLTECSVPAWCWMMCFLALTPLWLFFGVSWSLEPTLSRLVVWSATQPRWLQGCPLSLSLARSLSGCCGGGQRTTATSNFAPPASGRELPTRWWQGSFRSNDERAGLSRPDRQTDKRRKTRPGWMSESDVFVRNRCSCVVRSQPEATFYCCVCGFEGPVCGAVFLVPF